MNESEEFWESLEKAVGHVEFSSVLKEFCEWSGRDPKEFVRKAIRVALESDLEDIACHDVPRARELLEELRRDGR